MRRTLSKISQGADQ